MAMDEAEGSAPRGEGQGITAAKATEGHASQRPAQGAPATASSPPAYTSEEGEHDAGHALRAAREALSSWQHEPVDTDSAAYKQAVAYVEARFSDWLRAVALRGELMLEEIRSAEQRRAVLSVAARNGYELDSKRSTCQFAYNTATGHLFLRGSWKNPFVAAAVAQDLFSLQEEQQSSNKRREREGSRKLSWYFVDRVLHHDMLHLVRLLGYVCGVFRGNLAPSSLEQQQQQGLAAANTPPGRLECTYMYKLEVACEAGMSAELEEAWAAEREKLLHASTAGLQHPLPMPRQVMQNKQGMYHYCNALRPFFYHWTPHQTRCKLNLVRNRDFREGHVPEYVRSFCGVSFLRHEVDADGRLFLRLALRSAFYVFLRYAAALQACDTAAVRAQLQRLQASRTSSEDAMQLLSEAKTRTSHFGVFHFCLEHRYLTRELREMQHFAATAHYFVYVRPEAGVLDCITAVSRDLPDVTSLEKDYVLYFQPSGAYVGPERYASLVDGEYGRHVDLLPSLQSLVMDAEQHEEKEAAGQSERHAMTLAQPEQATTPPMQGAMGEETGWQRRPRSPSDEPSRDRRRRRRSSSQERQRRRTRSREPREVQQQQQQTPDIQQPQPLAPQPTPITTTTNNNNNSTNTNNNNNSSTRRYVWPRSVPLTEFYHSLLRRQNAVFVSPGVTQETHQVVWRPRHAMSQSGQGVNAAAAAVPVTFLVNHLTRTAQIVPGVPPPPSPPGWVPR